MLKYVVRTCLLDSLVNAKLIGWCVEKSTYSIQIFICVDFASSFFFLVVVFFYCQNSNQIFIASTTRLKFILTLIAPLQITRFNPKTAYLWQQQWQRRKSAQNNVTAISVTKKNQIFDWQYQVNSYDTPMKRHNMTIVSEVKFVF